MSLFINFLLKNFGLFYVSKIGLLIPVFFSFGSFMPLKITRMVDYDIDFII